MIPVGAWRSAVLWLAALVVGAGAFAQSGARCPASAPLTLTQVLDFISQNIPDDRTVELIESCHVSFSMDASDLDQLANVGASQRILDALNRMTASHLTLAEARGEAAELESHIAASDKAVNAERDIALQELDAQYHVQRARAAHIDPKGQFESTADYNVRVQQNQAALAAMDGKHKADRSQLIADYSEKAREKSRAYQERITFLQQNRYSDPRILTITSYNPDTQQMVAMLGDEEYQFDQVPGKTAETLVRNLKQVRVTEPYTDDQFHRRFLVLDSASISVSGYSLKEKEREEINQQLAAAAERMSRNDYAGALSKYQWVLARDPNNRAAKDGVELARDTVAAIEAERQRRSALLEEQTAAGEWVDKGTRFMWTLDDNGADITWKEAVEYCQALRKGGFADWRLPSIEELNALYDARSTRSTPPIPETLNWFSWGDGKSRSLAQGTFWQYHIAGGIQLTRATVWSTSKGTMRRNNLNKVVYLVEDFSRPPQSRNRIYDFPSEKHLNRALCLRPYSAESPQPAAVAARTISKQDVTPGPLAPRLSAAASQEKAENLIKQKRYGEAFPLAAQACSGGDREGCHTEGILYVQGLGVIKDQPRGAALISQACVRGSPGACFTLGQLYDFGWGVPQDFHRAVESYSISCNEGFAKGCDRLGFFYSNGIDVERDAGKARQLVEKACSLGLKEACDETRKPN